MTIVIKTKELEVLKLLKLVTSIKIKYYQYEKLDHIKLNYL